MKVLLILIIGFSLVSVKSNWFKSYHFDQVDGLEFSSNPPTSKTGAPGEGDCTECHSGSAQSGFGIVNYSFSGIDQKYGEGQTYDISIGSATGNRNGFEMVILDENNNSAGSFSAGPNVDVINSNGRNYVRHSASAGINTWTINWTAPAIDVGDLTVYYSYNKSNDDGTSSGDPIYLGQQVIYSSYVAGITEYEELDNHFNLLLNSDDHILQINYQTNRLENIQVQIRNSAGSLVLMKDYGSKNKSNIEYLDISQIKDTGIYIVSLFIGNKVFNRKIII